VEDLERDKLILIEKTVRDLRYVWIKQHDLRFGQLMENLLGCNCVFHRSDEEFAEALKTAMEIGVVDVKERP
jgi:hypothetical protein